MTSTNLMSASRNLMTRPADEHFSSFSQLLRAARSDDQNARIAKLPVHQIAVDSKAGQLLVRSRRTGSSYPMTYNGARAIARLAGVNPDFIFGRVGPDAAAEALDDSLSRTVTPEGEEVALHFGTTTGDSGGQSPVQLRGATSSTYARVADVHVLSEVDRWLLGPTGYKPALPTKNTTAQRNNIMGNNKPALFRGDRDLFAFFMVEETVEGAGGRPVRRGVIVENSEVGARSLWLRRFIFDDLCANFIIWGAREMQQFRAIHRGEPMDILRRFRDELQLATPAVLAKELETMRKAAEIAFSTSEETAVERLIKQFELSEKAATAAVLLTHAQENRLLKPLTVASIANGVTSLAKGTEHADKLVELASVGGRIYELAGV